MFCGVCLLNVPGYGLYLTDTNGFKKNTPDDFHQGTGNAHIQELNVNHRLFKIARTDIEGYKEMLSGSEFFSYPSIREDVGTSMIARTTNGKMAIEFLTGEVPMDYSESTVTFLMLSDMDLNLNEPFDVKINDEHLLTFHTNMDGTLTVSNNLNSSDAEFVMVRRDANGDGLGVFRLTVPTSLLAKGESAKVRIAGQRKNSNCWIMIFKADDAVEHLKKSSNSELAFVIKESNGTLYVDAPMHFSGKSVHVVSDGMKSSTKVFKRQGELAKASFAIPPPKQSFSIVYQGMELELEFEDKDGTLTSTDIKGPYLYHHQTYYKNGWFASLSKLYKPQFYETFDDFFDNKYEKGTVSIMNSSHQDIAWVDRPEVCIILRDTLLLTPVIKDAFVRSDYGFDIEDGLMLREYLNRHPDSKEQLTTLLNQKLLSVGASYNCPYEDMYDSEDQVRQLYLGKKWVKKTFGGYDSKVYWNVDVPGRSLQTPQILKKAGVDYMVISRHEKGMFHWASPDGSSVFTYSPGHYGYDLIHLSRDMNHKMKYGADQVRFWEESFNGNEIQTPLLSSQDMLPAIDYSEFIGNWNAFDTLKDKKEKDHEVFLPKMELRTMDEYMPMAEKNATQIDTIMGERPNVWVYIHGPSHHNALTASRKASKLLPAAEKFLTVAHRIDPKKIQYPYEAFDEAWQSKIYPDHGWGGHDGDVTDNLFESNLVKSMTMGESLLNRGVDFIARRIDKKKRRGMPIVLFNSLSWTRTDPVTTTVNFAKGRFRRIKLVSKDNKAVPSQSHHKEYYQDGSLKSAQITFIAENIPSIGYTTFYIQEGQEGSVKPVDLDTYENEFYRVEFERGGISQVYDKELGKNLFSTDGFRVGDVFTMESIGNGAGEFGDVQQPTMVDFDQVGHYGAKWEVVENGPVFTKYRLQQQVLHAIVRQEVTLYHKLKRLYFDTSLRNWSGELYREFRTAFPVNMDNAKITYEVPFGSVQVGKDEIKAAGDMYTALSKDVHPRGIMDWIQASNDDLSITMSSSVAAADWIDPTKGDSKKPVLQHLLLASRTSCHWEGNEYSQGGNHYFNNVLTSTKSSSMLGQRIAKQHNEPLITVVNPDTTTDAYLAESTSFFSIDNDKVLISTIKEAEDSQDIIARMYNIAGSEEKVNLSSYFDIDSYFKTNIIEEYPTSISPELLLGKYAIETFGLQTEKE